jgi:hypothetical protein
MDLLDVIINFLNLTDDSNLAKIHFRKLTDSNEYKDERVISFFTFMFLIICYIILVLGIILLIYKFFKQL